MATLKGRTLGGYLIEEELGRGAMGVVFKAKQLSMDRYVALKFLPNRLAQDEKVVARFLREARAAGQLSHPNIVGVHDAGVMEGLHFIAMEFVDGNSVHKRLDANGPYSEKETLQITGQIAEALKLAHGRGILHRDIKPDNFLIDSEGRVRLADLGLARFQAVDGKKEAELTQDGTAMGTPNYMSPEQCAGTALDARSDIYSLGASMFIMATGKSPYEANSGAAVMVKVMTEPPRSIKALNPNLSPGFVALVEKAMAKDPAKRFADAHQIADAIDRCKQGQYRPAFSGQKPHGTQTRGNAIKTGPFPPTTTPAQSLPPVASSKLKPLLIGAGAGVVALIAAILLLKNNGQQAAQNVVPFKPTPGKVDTAVPAVTAPADTKATPPVDVAAVGPEVIKRREAALKKLTEFIQEHKQMLPHNPGLVRVHLDDFLKDHAHIKLNLRARTYIEEIEEAEAHLKKDADTLRESTFQDIKEGHWIHAIIELLNFEKNYAGSEAAVKAHEEALRLSGRLQAAAQSDADAGKFSEALEKLNKSIEKLPPGFDETLSKQVAAIEAQQQKVKAQAEEGKKIAELHALAFGICRDFDAASGKRYRCEEAATVYRLGKETLKTATAQAEATALIEIYTRAAKAMERMKLAVNGKTPVDIELLKTKGRLLAWDEKGLTFEPEEDKSQTQSIGWKGVTPENLILIAQTLKFWSHDGTEENYTLGALAFAAGAEALAAEKLQRAAVLEPKLKETVDAAVRLLKVSAKPAVKAPDASRETLAKQDFELAVAAREKRDMDAIKKASTHLLLEYADTEFVQAHSKQIQELSLPLGAVKDPDVEKKDKETKDDALATAELKKLGWEEANGNWSEPQRGIFHLQGGGELIAKVADAAVQLSFQLEPGASIGIYFRYEPESEISKGRMKRLENYNIEVGRGYGFFIDSKEITVFGAKLTGGTGVRRIDLPEVPIKLASSPLEAGAHTVQMAVHGDKLELKIDDRPKLATDLKLRAEGHVMVIMEGNLKLNAPLISK